MSLFGLACLVLSCMSAPPSNALPAPMAVQAETAQAHLTVEAVKRMTSFWIALEKSKKADSALARAIAVNREAISLDFAVNGRNMGSRGVNIAAVAAQFSSVAADLKVAGLTVPQWEVYRRMLTAASVADQFDTLMVSAGQPAVYTEPRSELHALPVWQDVEFLRAHRKEYKALVASGMWFPTVPRSRVPGSK